MEYIHHLYTEINFPSCFSDTHWKCLGNWRESTISVCTDPPGGPETEGGVYATLMHCYTDPAHSPPLATFWYQNWLLAPAQWEAWFIAQRLRSPLIIGFLISHTCGSHGSVHLISGERGKLHLQKTGNTYKKYQLCKWWLYSIWNIWNILPTR